MCIFSISCVCLTSCENWWLYEWHLDIVNFSLKCAAYAKFCSTRDFKIAYCQQATSDWFVCLAEEIEPESFIVFFSVGDSAAASASTATTTTLVPCYTFMNGTCAPCCACVWMGIRCINQSGRLSVKACNKHRLVPMKPCQFRPFVLSGKNRNVIHHEVVQKTVPCKIREPF